MQERNITAHRVSLYNCGLGVLGEQGLAVRNIHSFLASTDFWVLSRFW